MFSRGPAVALDGPGRPARSDTRQLKLTRCWPSSIGLAYAYEANVYQRSWFMTPDRDEELRSPAPQPVLPPFLYMNMNMNSAYTL